MRLIKIGTLVLLLLAATELLPLNCSVLSFLATAQAQTTQDRKAEGDQLNQQGIQQCQTGQCEAALQSFQQALVIYREIHDRQDEGKALGNLGVAYQNLGNYAKAISYHQQALAIAREVHNRKEEGRTLNNLGLAYLFLSDSAKAINYHQQALVIAREIQNRQSEGKALGNLGLAYSFQGDYSKAIEYEQQALEIAHEIDDYPGVGKSLSYIGDAYEHLGNYAKAIEYEQQALKIVRNIPNPQQESGTLNNLGNVYASLGYYNKAINYYQQALGIAQQIQDREIEEKALGNQADTYQLLGNYIKAIECAQQELAISQRIHDHQSEGVALGRLGSIYVDLGNYSKAIKYEQQSLMISRKVHDRGEEGVALSILGIAYDYLNNHSKAIEYEQQALKTVQEIHNRQGEGASLNNLGVILINSGQLNGAKEKLEGAIRKWEVLRSDSGNDANKISIFEEQTFTYQLLQKILVAEHQPDSALEIAERGRARALVDLLAQRVGQEAEGRSQESGKPPDLAQIQQIAKTHNITLVEYSVIYDGFKVEGKQQTHDVALYIWVVQPDGKVNFRQADLKPLWQQQHTSLAQLVATARCFGSPTCEQTVATRSINRFGGVEVVYNPSASDRLSSSIIHSQSNTSLQQLHQLLIEPIADLLPTDPTAHVIFMPQGSLFLVPFAALQDKSNHYLIQQHTISIAPSIQVLSLTHQQQAALPKITTPSVLVAGDPTMPKVLIPGEDAPLTLPDLPGARQEAIAVAKALNTTALVGNQATKHVITQQMQTARMIHLATHGLLDDFKGLGIPGAIALAPDGTGQPNDGLLTADDILSMKLKAELVVLSACDTGQGRLTGDGVVGLSRSLISAGVPSVVVSLWSIPDAPTASLMTQFYQNLQRNPDKAEALRQAMLTTMRTNPDPIDWAAFTLIGEAQ